MLNRKTGEVMLRRLGHGAVGEAQICNAPCGMVDHCPFNPLKGFNTDGLTFVAECPEDPAMCVEQWIELDYQGAVAAFLGEHVESDTAKVARWTSESEAIAQTASAILNTVIDALAIPVERQAEIHGKVLGTGFDVVALLGDLVRGT